MWFNVGKYEQKSSKNEITCTCIWTTMEMSRYPKHPEQRKDCKHIKEVRVKIGQEEIYNLLKEKNRWMTVKQIAKKIGNGISTVNTCINKLFKQKVVVRRDMKTEFGRHCFEYRIL